MVTARLRQLELPLLSDVRCVLNACDSEGEALFSPSEIPDGFGYSSNRVGGVHPAVAVLLLFIRAMRI